MHLVYLDAPADAREQRNRQFAAEVLAELTEPLEKRVTAIAGPRFQHGMPEVEAEQLQQCRHPILEARLQQTNQYRVTGVERDANGDRLAVAHMIARQRLDLVRCPVAEVQGSCAAALEWVASVRNLVHVELGAASNHGRHHTGLEQ